MRKRCDVALAIEQRIYNCAAIHAMALANGTRLGAYEIVSSLGAGGMGEVYRARDTKLDRLVAIKVLPAPLADNAPDGRGMAYRASTTADALQRTNVYVIRFPEATGRLQVTSQGGGSPFWSRDGRELFFTAPPGVLQVVPVASRDRLQLGVARTLFKLSDLDVFGVSPDGSRFLAARMPAVERPTDIVVVQNWFAELTRLAPKN